MKKPERWKPENLRMEKGWVGNGILAYTCNAINSNQPVGTVWVHLTSNTRKQIVCDVVDIYVPQNFRRLGIGTHVMKWLLDNYGILKTGTGTKDGGKALLKSMGWKQNRETTEWYLKGKPKPVR